MTTTATPTAATKKVPVTTETFTRAESDLYFSNVIKMGSLGKFHHDRKGVDIDNQSVIRLNRDTLYSSAVFDLNAGPVTITLPDAGKRFRSMQVINEDQYTQAVNYHAGSYDLTRENIGTRYVVVAIRTLVDPADAKDVNEVHALQDGITVKQASIGKFEIPNWDLECQKKIREALLVLGASLPDSRNMFGTKDQVDPVKFLIGSAMAWGGNPEKDATYINVTPAKNDGTTVHKLTVKGEVPVDGFWSISIYNAQGYFQKNDRDAYSINNLTAKKDADGSVTVQFGGCEGGAANCLPIMPGWNYIARLYRPRKEILDGTFNFPEAQPL
jgi:hypothetical protein